MDIVNLKPIPNRKLILLRAIIILICAGVLYTWAVFVKPLIALNGWDLSITAMIGSTMVSCYVIGIYTGGRMLASIGARKSSAIGAILLGVGFLSSGFVPADKPWLMYFTYSVVAGLGVGILYQTSVFNVGLWFPDRKGFAMGISLAAFGGSAAFLAPTITKITALLGIKATFVILGIAFIIIVGFCSAGFQSPPEGFVPDGWDPKKAGQIANVKNYTVKESMKTWQFYLYALGISLFPSAYLIIMPLDVIFCLAAGLPLYIATLAVTFTAMASVTCRIVLSYFLDKHGYRKVFPVCWALNVLGVMILLNNPTGYTMILAFMCIGAAYGGSSPPNMFLCMTIWGPKNSAAIYGTALLPWVATSSLVPMLSLVLKNATGSYQLSFIIVLVICSAAAAGLLFIRMPKLKETIEDAKLTNVR